MPEENNKKANLWEELEKAITPYIPKKLSPEEYSTFEEKYKGIVHHVQNNSVIMPLAQYELAQYEYTSNWLENVDKKMITYEDVRASWSPNYSAVPKGVKSVRNYRNMKKLEAEVAKIDPGF